MPNLIQNDGQACSGTGQLPLDDRLDCVDIWLIDGLVQIQHALQDVVIACAICDLDRLFGVDRVREAPCASVTACP